jgi:hypothetical protein
MLSSLFSALLRPKSLAPTPAPQEFDLEAQEAKAAGGPDPKRRRRMMMSSLLFGVMFAVLVVWFMNTRRSLEKQRADAPPKVEDRKRPEAPPVGTPEEMLILAKALVNGGWEIIGRKKTCGHTRVQVEIFGAPNTEARKLIEGIYHEYDADTSTVRIEGFPSWKNGQTVVSGAHVTMDHLKRLIQTSPTGRAAPSEEQPVPVPAPAPVKKKAPVVEEPRVVELPDDTVVEKEEPESDDGDSTSDDAIEDALLNNDPPAPAVEIAEAESEDAEVEGEAQEDKPKSKGGSRSGPNKRASRAK